MLPVVFRNFISTLDNEGNCPWMYLDRKKLVTTGRGNLIEDLSKNSKDPAAPALDKRLHWFVPGGREATDEEVRNKWEVVKSHQELAEYGGGAFDPKRCPWNTLVLKQENIDSFVGAKAHEMARELSRHLNVDAYPADAQLALLRWAWFNGASTRFMDPKMREALKRPVPDFDTAGQYAGKGFNFPVKLLLKRLFQNATDVMTHGWSFNELVWPKVVTPVIRKAAASGGGLGGVAMIAAVGYLAYAGYRKVTAKKESAPDAHVEPSIPAISAEPPKG